MRSCHLLPEEVIACTSFAGVLHSFCRDLVSGRTANLPIARGNVSCLLVNMAESLAVESEIRSEAQYYDLKTQQQSKLS